MKIYILALLLIGTGCEMVPKAHYEYDKKAYDTVSPTVRRAIENDPSLTPEQKKERLEALDEWGNVVNSNVNK